LEIAQFLLFRFEGSAVWLRPHANERRKKKPKIKAGTFILGS
jgi:hypothetical protein